MNIKEIIAHIAKEQIKWQTVIGTVLSVDKETCTCVVRYTDGVEIENVNLRAVIDGENKGFVLFPKIGSYVFVTIIENNEYNGFVSMFEELDEMHMRSDEFGGLVKVNELIAELEKLTARVDAIIDLINAGAANGAGAVVFAGIGSPEWIDINTNKEDFSDIENEKVKHG